MAAELFIIVGIHSGLNAGETEGLDSVDSKFDTFGHQTFFLVRETTEHIVNLCATWKIIANAEFQTCVILGVEHLSYVLKTVVPGITSARFDSDSAEG